MLTSIFRPVKSEAGEILRNCCTSLKMQMLAPEGSSCCDSCKQRGWSKGHCARALRANDVEALHGEFGQKLPLTYQNLLFCRVPINSILGFIIRTYKNAGYGSLRSPYVEDVSRGVCCRWLCSIMKACFALGMCSNEVGILCVGAATVGALIIRH